MPLLTAKGAIKSSRDRRVKWESSDMLYHAWNNIEMKRKMAHRTKDMKVYDGKWQLVLATFHTSK